MKQRKAPEEDKSTRAWIYVRVSSDEQAREGVSLEAQLAACASYAAAQGYEVAPERAISDNGNGKGCTSKIPLGERPGGRVMLDVLARGDTIITTKLDRVARSVVESIQLVEGWQKRGVDCVVLDFGGQVIDTTTPMGKLWLTMVAAFAEFERGMIGKRTADALAHKRQCGEYTGGAVPYGYRLGDVVRVVTTRTGNERRIYALEPEPAEQETIARARELDATGLSLRAIGRELITEGRLPRRGKVWHPNTIARDVLGGSALEERRAA